MAVVSANEKVLSVPIDKQVLAQVKGVARRRDMRLREAVEEAIALWTTTMDLVDEADEVRRDRRRQRLRDVD